MNEQKVFNKLASFCAKGEHCSKEIREKMIRMGVNQNTQTNILTRLIKENYVNDERFTRAYCLDKIRFDKWGRRKIEQGLWRKGVNVEIIRHVLDNIDEEEYLSSLQKSLETKRKSLLKYTPYERNMRLIRYALGRGYNIEQAKLCLDRDCDVDNF